jgi:signal transduction histidine kinase
MRCRDILFPNVPLVFVGMSRYELDAIGTMPGSTGAITDLDVIGTLEAALTLKPSTRRLMVILGASPYEKANLDVKKIEKHFGGRFEVAYLVGESVSRLREILGELSTDTLVYYAHVFADDAGMTYVPADVLEAISPASAAPIFGAAETYVGRGIVGGRVYVPERVGQAAAELVLRVLRGESPESIPAADVQSLWVFDAREVARWGLNEADLPPDSEIRFRERTLWSERRAYILGPLVFIILQTLLIGFLLRERQVRLRAESRALSLGHRLATAHEEERMELARDLHDNLQQQLGFLAITVGRLQEALASAGVQSPAPGIVRDRLVCLSGEVRALAHRLHPPELEQLGLTEALRVECARFSQVMGIPVRLIAEAALPEPPRTVGLAIYRVVQEALQNVAKHARARGVVVSLEVHDGRLLLGVRDDGQGFRPGPKIRLPSLGLFAMRERVRVIGGSLQIDSSHGDGTAVLVSVPLPGGDRL